MEQGDGHEVKVGDRTAAFVDDRESGGAGGVDEYEGVVEAVVRADGNRVAHHLGRGVVALADADGVERGAQIGNFTEDDFGELLDEEVLGQGAGDDDADRGLRQHLLGHLEERLVFGDGERRRAHVAPGEIGDSGLIRIKVGGVGHGSATFVPPTPRPARR